MRTNNNQRSIGRTIISNNVFVGATRNGDILRGNSGTVTDKDLFYILCGPIQIINIVGTTWMYSLCKITNCFFLIAQDLRVGALAAMH